jgi:CheY-like chemotaxis protein
LTSGLSLDSFLSLPELLFQSRTVLHTYPSSLLFKSNYTTVKYLQHLYFKESLMQKTKPRILFVDDHEDTRLMVITWLGTLGYDVTATHSVREGLKLAENGRYDLYLLDSRLADGDGKDLCERLRAFDELTPIVFYAGDIRERVMADSDCETQGFVMKPEIENLPRIIGNALNAVAA